MPTLDLIDCDRRDFSRGLNLSMNVRVASRSTPSLLYQANVPQPLDPSDAATK